MSLEDHADALLLRMSASHLSAEERQALRSLPMTVRSFGADQDIVREGDRPSECCLILEGFACRYILLQNGKRQIISFHPPGDIPDLQSLHLNLMDHSLGTLMPSRAAFIPHASLHEINARYPRIAGAFWRDTLIDSAIFRLWIVAVGRRSATARVAHLLCELQVRLQAIGLANRHSYALPITQAEMGDALGLSTVHVNRVLQELRGRGLISLSGGSLTIHDWEGLKKVAGFDAAYLHLTPKEEVQ